MPLRDHFENPERRNWKRVHGGRNGHPRSGRDDSSEGVVAVAGVADEETSRALRMA